MKKNPVYAITIIISLCLIFSSCNRKYDRHSLVSLMEQYLAALPQHDPSGLPLASDVILVENTQKTPVGKGLWETATGGPTDFRILVADPVSGEVAFMGVTEVNNKPAIIAVRLKVVKRKITEIDHLVIPSGNQPLNPNMERLRPEFTSPVSPEDRMPRSQMLKIADSYYEAIIRDDGTVAPLADECQRRENGNITAYYYNQTLEEAATDDFSVFRKMKCSDQLSTGVMSYITDINRRRILAVDEEMGLVFAFSVFVHNGEPKVMKISGVPGITERANNYGPFDLPAAHVFKIVNGKITSIEAIGYIAPHGINNGWE